MWFISRSGKEPRQMETTFQRIKRLEREKAELLHALREIVKMEEQRVEAETRLFDESRDLTQEWLSEAREIIERLEDS
jgi:hypothetical protein